MKLKPILQHDERDCGAACLAMILEHYGRHVPIQRIRSAAGSDTAGAETYKISKIETYTIRNKS